MAARAKFACLAHAGELVRCFHGAFVVQLRQQLRRIEVCRVDAGQCALIGRDKGHATEFRPVSGGLGIIIHGDQIHAAVQDSCGIRAGLCQKSLG